MNLLEKFVLSIKICKENPGLTAKELREKYKVEVAKFEKTQR